MGLRNGESLIQYKQGLFSRIKNTIVSLFSNDEKEENKTANVGHDRLHEVLMQDRIRNNDIRVTKTEEKFSVEEVVENEVQNVDENEKEVGKNIVEIANVEETEKPTSDETEGAWLQGAF